MRIHSDVLTPRDFYAALPSLVYVPSEHFSVHRSRSRERAFEVKLRGYGARHTRRPNSGTRGADGGYAATYDDWGFWLAELFRRDPDAIAGRYKGAADFERQTTARAIDVERRGWGVVGQPLYPVGGAR